MKLPWTLKGFSTSTVNVSQSRPSSQESDQTMVEHESMQEGKDLEKGIAVDERPAPLSRGTARPSLTTLRSLSRVHSLSISTIDVDNARPTTQKSDITMVDDQSMQEGKDHETGEFIDGPPAPLSYGTARPKLAALRTRSRVNVNK